MTLQFELAVYDYDLAILRWPVALGRVGSAPYQALACALEPVVGVNRVEVLRYSAYIELAEHVESLAVVLDSIRDHLEQDEELAAALRGCGVTDYGVFVAAGVVDRP